MQALGQFSPDEVETGQAAAQILECFLILYQFCQDWEQIEVCDIVSRVDLESVFDICDSLFVVSELGEEEGAIDVEIGVVGLDGDGLGDLSQARGILSAIKEMRNICKLVLLKHDYL